MTIEDFDYSDVNDYYGIDNFAEINSYIIESGLDVESACKQLGLTPEKIDIVNLIYSLNRLKEVKLKQTIQKRFLKK